jgi:ATP-binding cassette subfamily C protein
MRQRWLLLIPVAIVASAAEVGAASAIFLLLTMLTDPPAAMAIPSVTRLISWLPSQAPRWVVLQLTLLVAAYFVGRSLLMLGAQYLRHRIAKNSSAYLASEMLRRYLTAPYPFHFRRNSAELIRNCTTSVSDVLGRVLVGAVGSAADLCISAGLIAVLAITSPASTIAAGAVLIAIMLLILRLTRRAAERLGSDSHELASGMIKSLQQALGSIKEVKLLGRESYFYDAFADRQRRLLRLGYLDVTLASLPSTAIQTMLVCGALAIVAVLTLAGKTGAEAVPIVSVFGYAGLRILNMGGALVVTLNDIRRSRRAVDELYQDFVTLDSGARAADAAPVPFTNAIALDGVSYSYPGSDAVAIEDVSLTIARGESIGIVGPTGAGKSTLVDLILGLLPPSSGRITIDGTDLATTTSPWKRRIGYVPQNLFLVDDTVRRNVALGLRDDEIDERRLRTVLATAQLEDFIAELPEGLDTLVGERGIRLSGGERQRVAIARALYHDPELIVFDEATSSLDVVTEAEVSRAMHALRGVKTIIVIAHRLSTVKQCDRLVWLRAGHLSGLGSFDELRSRHDDFLEMAALAAI